MAKQYTTAVIGAGTMGSGIAQKMALEGLKVYLVDMKEEYVQNGLDKIKASLKSGVENNVYPQETADQTLKNLKTTTDYADLKDVDFLVEAVFEDFDVKSDVFQQLNEAVNEDAIFSSNTSSFYVKDLAEASGRPDRFVGYHYFFPPVKNRLLEIIAHEGTSDETVAIAQEIGDLHNKTIIDVKDAPGFAVNRFFVPWLNEATRLLEDGVANIPTIDEAAKEAFKVTMGPFELMNASGIAIGYHSAVTLGEEISEFYKPTETLRKQTELGEDWDIKTGEVDESKFDEVNEHLLATTLGIAARLVDEGIATVEDTDRGAKVGLKWQYGPFELINQFGPENVYQWTKELAEKRPGFELADNLKEHAENNTPYAFQFVSVEAKNGVSYITINRPEAMNALNPTVADQLTEAYDQAEADSNTTAIALRGKGKAFIAGADLKFFIDCIKNDDIQRNVEFTTKSQELLRRMETSDKKTIAILDGLSLGGGSEVALAQNEIVATDDGSFGFPESGLGIYPGMGGMVRMLNHVGKELTKYYAMTGKSISAQEAKELGIVSDIVEPTAVENKVEELAKEKKRDKYADRELPAQYDEIITAFSDENIEALKNGESIEGVSDEFVQKISKTLSYKGPNALKEINDIIDQEAELSIDESIELELERLAPIFETKEALHGLESSVKGERPDYKSLYETTK
jgi:enoyl-CoA hydratase/3-hydroxyacyl-CoA dehydrogenase